MLLPKRLCLSSHPSRAGGASRLEVPPPEINMANRNRHDHHRKRIKCVGNEAEGDAVALADSGDGQIGGCSDQGTIATEARAER